MSLGNMDARLHQIQGLVGLNAAGMGGFPSALARQNQGVAITPDLIRDIVSRADLSPSLNLFVAMPLANAAAVNAVAASAAKLVGVIVDNNEASVLTQVQVFNTAAGGVTLGTTVARLNLAVVAQTMDVFLLPSMPDYATAISWDATTLPNGSVRSTSGKVTVAVIYAL